MSRINYLLLLKKRRDKWLKMGRDKVEVAKMNGKSPDTSKSKKDNSGSFVSFNPTKEEKELIRERVVTAPVYLDEFGEWAMTGYLISMGYNTTQQAFFVQLKKRYDDKQEIPILSCWHSSLDMAMNMLYFYLTSKNPEWPDGAAVQRRFDTDW